MKAITENRIDPELVATRPDIAITVSREFDDWAHWDVEERGEEQPDELSPYILTVTVTAIRDGKLYVGERTLSESWCADDEPLDDLHGYYDDLLAEAVEELDRKLAGGEPEE